MSARERTMTAHRKLEVDDQWPEGGPLKARKVVEALQALKVREPFEPAAVAFYAEEGLPWIEVQYDKIAHPGQVVPIGNAIHAAIGKPVLFQALRPNSICFIVGMKPGSFTQKPNDPHLSADQYGVLLDELEDAWQLSRA
jgi:hypothetical protein